MVIMLRKITDLGTPEEKVKDTRIADVQFVDGSSVPAITYHCDSVPRGWKIWDRIGDARTLDKDGYRTFWTVLVIDGKEYDEVQVKEHYSELKVLFDRIYTEKLLQEIDDDQGSFESV